MAPLWIQFLFTMIVFLVIGAFIGAVYMRNLSAGWKESAKRWRIEVRKQKEYNWHLAQESYELDRDLQYAKAEIETWKDHYNQAVTAETKLREQLLENGIKPNA